MSPLASRALVRSAWIPARAEPDHRAELSTQWVCGELLELLEDGDGWLRCRGEDGYEAWTPAGGVLRVDSAEAEGWRSRADALSLGTGLVPTGTGPPAERPVPPRLPLGSRVRLREGGELELPDGGRARPLDPRGLVRLDELPARFRPDGDAVATTARRWLGVPYVWGGRTEWGFDCSGLVQVAFRLHGVRLPRDSGAQRAAGPDVPGLENLAGSERLRPGDLLFFAPEGRGITHVAIHAGEGRILHAAASNGCVAVDDLGSAGELTARLRSSVVAATRPLAAREGAGAEGPG